MNASAALEDLAVRQENTPLWRHAYDLALSHFFHAITHMRNHSKLDCRQPTLFYAAVVEDRFGAVPLLRLPTSTHGYYRCIAILYVHPLRLTVFFMARCFYRPSCGLSMVYLKFCRPRFHFDLNMNSQYLKRSIV